MKPDAIRYRSNAMDRIGDAIRFVELDAIEFAF
jgi:hypothetical protein